ncbi:ribonuclease T2 family protein [Halomonas halocynthiae]|uniref:ribonuclease T2 family protein n=1 Tax=Halomonas halocynthiae TaxID=176290 RepID=UPI0004036D8C|nr:ribonuclease I [Halomonas halocynthiae]
MLNLLLKRLNALLVALLFSHSAMADIPAIQAEGFTSYTLALTWHGGFCESRSRPPRECRNASLSRGADDGFVLHGLWPSLPQRLREQGVTASQWRKKGCFLESPRPSGSFCRNPPLALSSNLSDALDYSMPGRASCLGRYQHAKHAACLGITADDLFDTSVALVETVNNSDFGTFVRDNSGHSVDRNALIDAFENAFGQGTGRALHLTCGGRGKGTLTEVRIGIHADQLTRFPARNSLMHLNRGNCARQIKLPAPR